jgi:hypothetical protein
VGRLHLFEFHDLGVCPPLLRQSLTELLQKAVRWTRIYEHTVPLLQRLLERAGEDRVVDLCSGSGGPWADLHPRLVQAQRRPVELVLTDLYPDTERLEAHQAASGGAIRFEGAPVDATDVPPGLDGVRTLFSSFHHFRPADAQAILRDAARRRVPIGVFEGNERSVRDCALFLVGIVPTVWVWTLFLRPVRWTRLFWTYAVPVYPLVMLWDGLVSNLRTYSPAELEALVAEIEVEDYRWEVGKLPGGRFLTTVTYLIGYPQEPIEGSTNGAGAAAAATTPGS